MRFPSSALLGSLAALRAHRVLVGVLLLPMLLGSLIVWSLGDRAESTEQIRAVVVNEDQPVLEKGQQPVAAGRILSAGLTSPTKGQDAPLTWELTDAEDAARGLEEGEYYAVLRIPKTFSRTVSDSLQGKDPRRATLTVITDDASSALAGQVAAEVGRVAADRLGEGVTQTYLETFLSGTGELADKLGKAADGAGRLAAGTERLGSGTDRFADGLGRLADGADRLADGATRLASGGRRLADGTDRLASGAQRLAGGLGILERRTDPLPRQTDRLADGARQVAEGVEGYSKLLEGWRQACTDPIVAARATRLCALTIRAVGVDGSRARQLRQGADQVADGARLLANGMPELTQGIDAAASGAGRLAGGAAQVASGTERLAGGAAELGDGARRLADGAQRASTGADQLASGTERLSGGSQRLATGLERGAEAVPAFDKEESSDLADVIASPVAARTDQPGETPDGETQLAPATIAFALWLGAFVTYLVRPALPRRLLGRPRAASRIAGVGLLPGLVIGAVQTLLLYAAMLVLGADLGSPVAALVLMLLASASFAAINQALVALFGRRRGWLASIAFAGLQAVSLGGVIPVETAPAPLPLLNTVLPMTAAADGLVSTILAGPGSVAAAVAVLLVWAGLAFAGSTYAARRAQMVDLTQLQERAREPELVG